MKKSGILLPLLTAFCIPLAIAQDYTVGKIRITQAWTPQPPAGSQVAGGFLTIKNEGDQPDTLTGGSVAVAGRFEIHEMSMDGGIMKMRELRSGLVIKPGESVVLKPGSFHIMMMDLKEQPIAGKAIKGTLVFEKAGKIDIEYKVEPTGTRSPAAAGDNPSSGSTAGGMGHDHHKGHK